MGLLDAIFPSSDGGGLLDFLKNNAAAAIAGQTNGAPGDTANYGPTPGLIPTPPQAQPVITASGLPPIGANVPGAPQAPIVGNNQTSPLDNARWPYGPVGAPSNAMAQMQPPTPQNPPAAAAPRPVAAPQAQPQALPPAIQNAATAPAFGAGSTANPVSGFLHNAATALMNIPRGGAADPAMVAAQQQANTANLTRQMLMNHGYSPQDATALVQPGNSAALGDALKQISTQNQWAQETDKDGNVWNVNKLTGQKTIALASKDDKFSNVAIKNPDGSTTNESFNTKTGEYGPPQTAPGASASPILGDATKTGPAYLATLPADKVDTVKGMLDGTIQPPTSFAAAKPYWQQLITAAKHADPTWDENNWAARHKMSIDLASSGNSSMGGILSNGESSFKHLAEYTKSVADQGNVSHDFPLGGIIAHAQNETGNWLGGSNTQAKVKAVNDNLGHYGQESTKFYAGTGGGVEERLNALKEMNANSTSGEEAAAYAEKEKGLMLDRLNQKLQQIKNVFGEDQGNRIIAQHMPEIQKSIAMINANIDRLRGIQPGAPGSASLETGADTEFLPPNAPAAVAPPKLMVGQSFTAPNGVKIKKTSEGNQ